MLLLPLLLTNYVSRLPLVELNIHLLGWTRIPMTSCLELSRTGQPGLVELQVLWFSSLKFETGAVLCSNVRVVTVVSQVSCGSYKEITAMYEIGGRTSVNQLYSFKYKCVCCFSEMTLSLFLILKYCSFYEVLVENPWDTELICKFLSELPKPLNTYDNYFEWKSALPTIKLKTELPLGKSYLICFILKHLLQVFLGTPEVFFLIQFTYAYIQIASRLSKPQIWN